MSARRPDCANVYDAADIWIDRALVNSDSLFTPGTCIWSPETLAETWELFSERKDEWDSEKIPDNLKAFLADSPPKVRQLMGEALYVSYLVIYKETINKSQKMANINEVLGCLCKTVEIPNYLVDGLRNGIISPGGYPTGYKYRLKAVIQFANGWKSGGSDKCMLDRKNQEAPWRFQRFLAKLKISDAQQMPILHLVHPCTFEPLVWENKKKVAEAPAFHDHIADMKGCEVNRKIHRIRAALEPKHGCCFHFIDCLEVCRMWNDKCKGQ